MKKTLIHLMLFIFISCSEEKNIQHTNCPEERKGIFIDKTGIGACTFLIKLEDGKLINPINLSDFTVQPEDGKQISLSFQDAGDMASVCMIGRLVKISCIKEM